jgi:hypothetical protein
VFVDTDGFMYPCFGLLGVEAARLGSVYEDPEDTVFGGRPTPLDLSRLARYGPGDEFLAGHAEPKRSGLPVVCENHRLHLLPLDREGTGEGNREGNSEGNVALPNSTLGASRMARGEGENNG